MGNSLEACESTTKTHEWAGPLSGGKISSTETTPCEHHDKPVSDETVLEASVGGIVNISGVPIIGYKYSEETRVVEHDVPEEPNVPEEPRLSEDEIPTTLKRLHEMSHAG